VSQYSSVIIVTMVQSWRPGNCGLFLSRGKDQLLFRCVSGTFVLQIERLFRDHSSSCSSEPYNKNAQYYTSFSFPYIFTGWWLTLHLEKCIFICYIKLYAYKCYRCDFIAYCYLLNLLFFILEKLKAKFYTRTFYLC
jgi:hypothetical protein